LHGVISKQFDKSINVVSLEGVDVTFEKFDVNLVGRRGTDLRTP